jgi:hypothetical protein
MTTQQELIWYFLIFPYRYFQSNLHLKHFDTSLHFADTRYFNLTSPVRMQIVGFITSTATHLNSLIRDGRMLINQRYKENRAVVTNNMTHNNFLNVTLPI